MAGFDDIKKQGLASGKLESLLQARQERMSKPSVTEGRVLDRLQEEEKKLNEVISNLRDRNDKKSEEFQKELERMQQMTARVKAIEALARQEETARMRGAEKRFTQGIRTAVGPRETTSDIARMQRSSGILEGSISGAQTRSTGEIENAIARKERLLERSSERVLESSQDIDSPEGSMRFGTRVGARNSLMQSLAADRAQLAMQHKMHLDIGSRYYNARDLASGVRSQRGEDEIRDRVARGEGGSQAQMKEKLSTVSDQMLETFERFEKALDSGADNVDELAKKFSDLAETHDEYSKTLKEMQSQGMGRGLSDQIADVMGTIGEVGMIVQGIGQGYRYQNVASELQREQVRTGFGQIGNERFTEALGATRGDMQSLRRVTTNRYNTEIDKALETARQSDIGQLLQAGGLVGQGVSEFGGTAVEAFAKGSAASAVATPGAGLMVGALSATEDTAAAMPTYLQAQQGVVDYYKQITTGQDLIARKQIESTQDKTRNLIGDQANQRAVDYMRQLGGATRGLGGSRRGDIQGRFENQQNIAALAEVGVGLDSIPGIIESAKDALGAEFRGQGAVQDVRRAGQLSRTGLIQSPEQMFQMRGMLSQVGGGQQDLETIMRQAVAAGMDSSKNIMQMVEATSELSRKSAAMGIDVATGAAGVSGRSFEALQKAGVPENMRGDAAKMANSLVQQAYGDTGLNVGNIVERAGITKAFGNKATFLEREVMSRLTPEQLEKLKKEGPGAAKDFGLENVLRSESDIDKLISASREGAETNITGMGVDVKGESLMRKQRAGQSLSKEDQAYLARYKKQVGVVRGVSGDAAFAASNIGGSVSEGAIPSGPSGAAANVEKMQQAGAVSDAKLFADSVNNFSKSLGGLDKLGDTMLKVAEQMSPTDFAKSVQDSMEGFTVPAEQFGDGVAEFRTTVGQFATDMKDIVAQLKDALAKGGKGSGVSYYGGGGLPRPNQSQRRDDE